MDEGNGSLTFNSFNRRNSSVLSLVVVGIEKEEATDMLDGIERTFKKLDQRTTVISETLGLVQKKQTKVHIEIKDNIDVIKEMKSRARLLLEQQIRISNNYKNVQQHVSDISYSDGFTRSSRKAYYDSESSDDDDYNARNSRNAYSEVAQRKSRQTYDDDGYNSPQGDYNQQKYDDGDDYSENGHQKYENNEEENVVGNIEKSKEDDDYIEDTTLDEPRLEESDYEKHEERYDEDYDDARKQDTPDEYETVKNDNEERLPETENQTNKNDDYSDEEERLQREEDEEYFREQERLREEEKLREEEFEEEERLREEEEAREEAAYQAEVERLKAEGILQSDPAE